MKLYLIRHGETTGDIEDRYGGAYDDHLTEKGENQLQTTAERLRGTAIDCIYHSPLNRAVESAHILNEVLGTELKVVDGLKERDYGVLSGLTKAEAIERYPEAVAAHKDPANTDPGGEPQLDFIRRVQDAFATIHTAAKESVAIVAHGGSLKVILKLLNQPLPETIGDGEIIEINI